MRLAGFEFDSRIRRSNCNKIRCACFRFKFQSSIAKKIPTIPDVVQRIQKQTPGLQKIILKRFSPEDVEPVLLDFAKEQYFKGNIDFSISEFDQPIRNCLELLAEFGSQSSADFLQKQIQSGQYSESNEQFLKDSLAAILDQKN